VVSTWAGDALTGHQAGRRGAHDRSATPGPDTLFVCMLGWQAGVAELKVLGLIGAVQTKE
jgi:hypothetical protein